MKWFKCKKENKKEPTLEEKFKAEFVKYAEEKGKDVDQAFWESSDGLIVSFFFSHMKKL